MFYIQALHQQNQVSCTSARSFDQCQSPLSSGREALLEEDVPDDEAAEELAPITAQLAYAHGELSRKDEALAAYQVRLCAEPALRQCNLCSL
jgi:hypothetical protein